MAVWDESVVRLDNSTFCWLCASHDFPILGCLWFIFVFCGTISLLTGRDFEGEVAGAAWVCLLSQLVVFVLVFIVSCLFNMGM